MFKWPVPPSPQAPRHVLADFAEMTCWKENNTSMTSLSRLLKGLEENDYSDGVPEEDDVDGFAREAFVEIENRLRVCRDGYPFEIRNQGTTLRVNQDLDNPSHVIYKYLLLATRLNMNQQRNQGNLDGTFLLEELGAEVGRAYFGSRAKSLVFGTAAESSDFECRINNLCKEIGEGGGFSNNSGAGRTFAKDGKLDVVVWKPFSDHLPGKLIGFGQCKTGSNYKDELTQLDPSAFREKWLRNALVVMPVRMFFVSEALALKESDRFDVALDAGLTFDRCRIVDFCDGVDECVLARLRHWTEAAAEANGLPRV